jgi:hypothetical protein
MIGHNPADLLELDSAPPLVDDVEATWAAALATSHRHHDHDHDD